MSQPSEVESVFFAALELGTTEARAAFLDAACAGKAEVRRQIEKMLKAHPRVGDFLQTPASEQWQAANAPTETQTLNPTADWDPARLRPCDDPDMALTNGDDAGEADPASLDFLESSSRPDSLGRMGHYEVLQVLGEGGFGIVLRAFDETLQRVVAVKVLSPRLSATSPARKRFLREARSSAKVRHANIVQVYAVEEQPLPYLVMEYIPGETLQQRLDRNGPLETPDVVRIGCQIAEGLAAAHAQGLIHRDIKPANILIEAGPNEQVKITDFGLARAADDASMTQSGIIAGTPMFMAPEQASGEKLDHRADLFSLGSVLYTMSSGRPPFRANSTLAVLKRVAEDTPRPIPEIIPEVPSWLCDIISRLHAKKPDDRIATAREVADLLGRGTSAVLHAGNVKPVISIQGDASLIDNGDNGSHVFCASSATQAEILNPLPMEKRRFRTHSPSVAMALFVALVVGFGLSEARGITNLSGTIIRLFSPEGTLVVEVDDPAVSVKVDGADVVITGAGASEVRVATGKHTVEATKNGKLVSRELVTITRNGRQVVKVTQELPPIVMTNVPSTEASTWERAVAAMPANQQIQAFVTRLKELNPTFDQPVTPSIHEGVVTGIEFISNQVRDISPVRAFPHLAHLNCRGDAGAPVLLDDLTPLKGMKLITLTCSVTPVSDLSPLKGMPLTSLHFDNSRVTDLSPLKGLPLTALNCSYTGVSSLEPLKGMSLSICWCNNTDIVDLGPLRGMPLERITIHGTRVTDLSPLKGMPIKQIYLDYQPQRDREILLSLTTLQKINDKSVSEFWKGVGAAPSNSPITDKPNATTFPDSWFKEVAALPPEKQVEAVVFALKERNPGFDGKLNHKIEDGVVTEVEFHFSVVADISPLKALRGLTSVGCASTKVADLSPLKGLKLQRLSAMNTQVSDLTPLRGMPLKMLDLFHSRGVVDVTPLRGMPLEYLNLTGLPVSDISALADMTTLRQLVLEDTPLTDLSPLLDLQLKELIIRGTRVSNLDAIKSQSLTLFSLDYRSGHAEFLRSFKKLEIINGKPAAEFWKEVEAQQAEFRMWLQRVSALSADHQVTMVTAKLKELNPGFDGNVTHKIENGVVAEIGIGPHVADISPIRALAGLKSFRCDQLAGGRSLAYLSPLKGMALTCVSLMFTQVTDLEPLKEMPLTTLVLWGSTVSDLSPLTDHQTLSELHCGNTHVSDLSPLKSIKTLTTLNVFQTRISDLSPLRDLNLTTLIFGRTGVTDLSPLSGMKLTRLDFRDERVRDLSPLKNLPLTYLRFQNTEVADLSPLKGMRLTELDCSGSKVTDLSPLTDMTTMKRLSFHSTGVVDLQPLSGMTLEEVRLSPASISRGLNLLRDAPSLKVIGIDPTHNWPAAEFWARYDKGEFK